MAAEDLRAQFDAAREAGDYARLAGVGARLYAASDVEGNRQARAEASQMAQQLGEAGGRVCEGALPADATAVTEHAHRVRLTGSIDSDVKAHCLAPGDAETLREERSCRLLTDRRSGLARHPARHPVAGLGPSLRLVRRSRSHGGRRAASDPGSPRTPMVSSHCAIPGASRDDFPRRIDEPSRQLAATPSPARAAHLRGLGRAP